MMYDIARVSSVIGVLESICTSLLSVIFFYFSPLLGVAVFNICLSWHENSKLVKFSQTFDKSLNCKAISLLQYVFILNGMLKKKAEYARLLSDLSAWKLAD